VVQQWHRPDPAAAAAVRREGGVDARELEDRRELVCRVHAVPPGGLLVLHHVDVLRPLAFRAAFAPRAPPAAEVSAVPPTVASAAAGATQPFVPLLAVPQPAGEPALDASSMSANSTPSTAEEVLLRTLCEPVLMHVPPGVASLLDEASAGLAPVAVQQRKQQQPPTEAEAAAAAADAAPLALRATAPFTIQDVRLFRATAMRRCVRHVILYAPYWVVNRTGLPLTLYQAQTLRRDIRFPDQQLPYPHGPTEGPHPILYSYPRADALGCKTALQYRDPAVAYAPSEPFTLDAVGTSGVVEVPQGRGRHELALTLARGTGPFRLTTIATLTRRFTFVSLLPPTRTVYLRPYVEPNASTTAAPAAATGKGDHSTAPTTTSTAETTPASTAAPASAVTPAGGDDDVYVPPSPDGEHAPMPLIAVHGGAPPLPVSWPVALEAERKAKCVQLAFGCTRRERWSGGVRIDEVGESVVALHDAARPATPYLARIQVASAGAALYVIIRPEQPDLPPYTLANETAYVMWCWQEGCAETARYVVAPRARVPFAWSVVCLSKLDVWGIANDESAYSSRGGPNCF